MTRETLVVFYLVLGAAWLAIAATLALANRGPWFFGRERSRREVLHA
jgi:hypothetical protein